MKRAIAALTLIVCSALTAQAQRLDPQEPLKSYAARVLPRCPGGVLSLEASSRGPQGFEAYVATIRSADKYCGTQKYLLYSPASRQVFVGAVVPLPVDERPAGVRVATHSTQLLGHKVTAVISPFPLPDGVRTVDIVRQTEFGPFSYPAFIDKAERFLIVGFRGVLGSDPSRTLRDILGTKSGARRGSGTGPEIIELSDFQCPTCAAAHEKVEPIIRKNLSKMTYVRIDLPLFEHHQWAVAAAMGARAIQRVAPAKYWEYVDYIFKNQEKIGERMFDEVIKEYCSDHDIDWAAVQKIYASKAEREALMAQVSRAFSVGITSTPTFIVNGQIMGFGPDGTFTIDAITRALGGTAAAK